MIVWGGINAGSAIYLHTGGRYTPATDTWNPTNDAPGEVPEGRILHTAVWTGSEMIVWGGAPIQGSKLNTGGHYNPAGDSGSTTGTGTGLPAAGTESSARVLGV